MGFIFDSDIGNTVHLNNRTISGPGQHQMSINSSLALRPLGNTNLHPNTTTKIFLLKRYYICPILDNMHIAND